MTKQRRKPRYFITALCAKDNYWTCDVDLFTNISSALKIFAVYKGREDYGTNPILAKEIYYKIVPNTRELSVKIVPIGDVNNNLPYYLIERFRGSVDTYGGDINTQCHRTTLYERWEDLRKELLTKEDHDVFIAKGLEVKI